MEQRPRRPTERGVSDLGARRLTYDAPGATRPGDADWGRPPDGYRSFERTVPVGAGEEGWVAARQAVLTWEVKTRSGFRVNGSTPVIAGERRWIYARVGPLRIHEPVEVVRVVDEPERSGFAYGTLQGHPVSGEESFIVHRDGQGRVWFTLRSVTRAAPGRWRWLFPVLRLAQLRYRRRYLRALLAPRPAGGPRVGR